MSKDSDQLSAFAPRPEPSGRSSDMTVGLPAHALVNLKLLYKGTTPSDLDRTMIQESINRGAQHLGSANRFFPMPTEPITGDPHVRQARSR